MTIINDFYTWASTVAVIGTVVPLFAAIGMVIWMVYAVNNGRGVQAGLSFIIFVLSAFVFVNSIVVYHAAADSVEHTLEQAGYKIIDGFPEDVGSDFVVEKDGRVQYCLTGYTFDGGNSVRIECKG